MACPKIYYFAVLGQPAAPMTNIHTKDFFLHPLLLTKSGKRPFDHILLACFFLSGATGLMYEIVWTRQLVLIFGSTTFAVSTILTAFMGGLALGSFLFGRLADRLERPVVLYGLLELGIGLYALSVPWILGSLTPIYQWLWGPLQPSFYLFSLVRFALAFMVLLLPTILMGGTLPILSKYFTQRQAEVGFQVGRLYALNTFGAVLGTVSAGFLLLPALGLWRTTLLTVGINLFVAVLILSSWYRWPAVRHGQKFRKGSKLELILTYGHGAKNRRKSEAMSHTEEARSSSSGKTYAAAVLIAFAISGFLAMTYEVAWTRLLTLILGSSTYAFTTMLAAFLVGLAWGSNWVSHRVDRWQQPLTMLALFEVGIGLLVYLGQYLVPMLPFLYLQTFKWFWPHTEFLYLGQFVLSFWMMLLPTFLLGGVLPLVMKIYGNELQRLGKRVGSAYAANTVGTVLGAFSAGFVLIPWLGIQKSVNLGIVLNFLLGLWLLNLHGTRRLHNANPVKQSQGNRKNPQGLKDLAGLGNGHWARVAMTLSLIACLALPIFLTPNWNHLLLTSGVYKDAPMLLNIYKSPRDAVSKITHHYKSLFYKEGVTATVSVVERPSLEEFRHLTLAVDGKVDASTALDMPTQVLSGHLPLLLHSGAQKVLVVGLASGVTVGAVAQHPVQEITVVEIEPAVVEASHFFDEYNHRPLQDPRVRLVVDDARNYLLVSPEKFDIIISEPSNPWMSGPAKLFTREFFELGRKRLSAEGIFVQWMQLYSLRPENLKVLVRTFHAVFPYVLIFQSAEADVLLLGSPKPLYLDFKRLQEGMAQPAISDDLNRIRVQSPFDLLVKFRLGWREIPKYTGAGPLNPVGRLSNEVNTDDNSLIEFNAPRDLYLNTIEDNVEEMTEAYLKRNEETQPALAYYLKNLSEAPDSREALWTDLTKKYLQTDQIKLAEATVRAAVTEAALAAPQEAAEAWWVQGQVDWRLKNKISAEEAWRKALERYGSHYPSLLSLAKLHQIRGEFEDAQNYLDRLFRLYPDSLAALYTYGLNLYYTDRWPKAAEVLQSLVVPPRAFDETLFAEFYLSRVYEQRGNRELAKAYLERFAQRLKSWRQTLETRPEGLVHLTEVEFFNPKEGTEKILNEESLAVQMVNRYVAAPLAKYYEGVTQYYLGYFEEAVQKLQAALHMLEAGDDSPLAHYYLGLAYAELGRKAAAISHLERFVAVAGSMNKNDRHFGDALERLFILYKK